MTLLGIINKWNSILRAGGQRIHVADYVYKSTTPNFLCSRPLLHIPITLIKSNKMRKFISLSDQIAVTTKYDTLSIRLNTTNFPAIVTRA